MKRLPAVLALLLSAAPAIADNATLARVNGEEVTAKQMLAEFTTRHGGHAKFLGGKNEARSFLNILIDERLLIQEAFEVGLDRDPSVVDAVAEFETQKATEFLVDREITRKSNPSKDEVRKVWETSLDFFLHIRQIAVATRSEAEEIRAAILQGADFDAFARDCSLADSRKNGGHVLVNWGQFEPEWERVVFALEPGELSPVIETRNGYEIVIGGARIDAPRPELSKVESQIEAVLRQRKLDARKKEYAEVLWKKYNVVVPPGADVPAINAPLVAAEAKEQKIAELPDVAEPVQKFRERAAETLLFRDHIFKDINVSDDDVRKYYDGHKSEFTEPEQRHVAQILVASEADAKAVCEKLAAGADFNEVARKSSRDYLTAMSGGDLGWITKDKVPEAFRQVLSLSTGEITKPIQAKSGWHVIKVLEIQPVRQLPLADVRAKVEKSVRGEKQQEARNFWIKRLRDAAKIEIDDAAVTAFVRANEFTGEAPPQHGMK